MCGLACQVLIRDCDPAFHQLARSPRSDSTNHGYRLVNGSAGYLSLTCRGRRVHHLSSAWTPSAHVTPSQPPGMTMRGCVRHAGGLAAFGADGATREWQRPAQTRTALPPHRAGNRARTLDVCSGWGIVLEASPGYRGRYSDFVSFEN